MIDEKKLIEKRTYYPHPVSDYETGWNDCNRDWMKRIEEQPQVGGWIPCGERLPSKEECGEYGNEFLVTVKATDPTTMDMRYVHTTVRGKDVERWEWQGRISPWNVIAWRPLPEPFEGR